MSCAFFVAACFTASTGTPITPLTTSTTCPRHPGSFLPFTIPP